MTKRGRKPIFTVDEAQKIVDSYIVNYEQIIKIKYIDIHRYCLELYDENKIDKIPNESFWRKEGRKGRYVIDITNKILSEKKAVEVSEQNYEQFMKILTKDNISRTNLTMIQNELKHHFDLITSKNEYIEKLESDVENQKHEIKRLISVNKKYEELLHNVYHSFLKKKTNENNKVFKEAFENMFSKPLSYTTNKKIETNDEEKTKKISNIFKSKLDKN